MGDRNLVKTDRQRDVENTPLAPDNTTAHSEDNAQECYEQEPGFPHAPGEQQEAESAWQGVPL